MRKGFTLIELLVVVLIIGILSAVALPQYQKAVEKARATQALTLLKSIGSAANVYYMANGDYPTSFGELDVDISNWTGNEAWRTDTIDTRSNGEWSLQLYKTVDTEALVLYIGRLTGKYKGVGFSMTIIPGTGNKYISRIGKIQCLERISSGIIYEGEAGSYCNKLFQGTLDPTVGDTIRVYRLP